MRLDGRAETSLARVGRERVMAGPGAAPEETVIGSFPRARRVRPAPGAPTIRRYNARGRYAGERRAAWAAQPRCGPARIAFTGTGQWLRMDKAEKSGRIPDEFLVRVRAAGAPRSRER